MKKKILIVLMVVVISIIAFGAISVSAETYGELNYSIINGEITITGCKETVTKIEIPSEIDGYSVTSIGHNAFYDCTNLISVSIGGYVSSIEDGAFRGCKNLKSITIPDSVTSIEDGAFDGCTGLTSVNISDISKWCNINFGWYRSNPLYYASNLYLKGELVTDLVIPRGVKEIKAYTFSECRSLKNIIISDGVTIIGTEAFYGCSKLESITIPDSVTSIGNYAFWWCGNLKKVNISSVLAWCNIEFTTYYSNPLSNKGSLYVNNELVKDLNIPEDVSKINDYAFYNCYSLESLTISDGVTNIGTCAFDGCYYLKKITVPSSVTAVGDYAFNGCIQLLRVYYNGVEENWGKISIGSNNTYLLNATRNYFWYIKLFSESNEENTYMCTSGSPFDFTIIPKKIGHTTKIYVDQTLTNELDITTPISKNIDLYFAYRINQYTYKFIDEDGSILKEETVDYSSVISPPENPSKKRTQKYTYTFSEWDGFTDGMTQEDREMIFTAKYNETKNQYTYKFLEEDGSILKEETADYGTPIIAPEILDETEYYLFDYWQGYTEGIILTDDITFTAVYKYNDYTITAEGLSSAIAVTYNSDYVIDIQTRELYRFVGYFTEKDGAGIQITNEKGESLNVYNTVGDLKVYPYFESVYMNKIEMQGTDSAMPGDTITHKAIFATDKDATYFIATVKYPKHLNFKSIKGVDFKEATTDSEKVVGDYKYLNITCVFDYEGNFAEINTNYIPFEIGYDVATDTPNEEYEISLENVILIGDNTFDITDITNHTITILPKLAESVEIIGKEEIDAVTQFSAIVSPDYTKHKRVVWSVNDESVATITQDGIVTPVKNGTVVITATAKDGSEVFATKTVNVIAYAKIDSLDFGSGVVLTEFNPDVRKYTVYVKENATSISLTPTFSGGVLRPNGSGIWVSGRAKEFELNGVETTITLNRENVTDMTNSVYTVEVIKFEGTKTEVLEDKKSFTITPINVESGKTVILALYDGEQFVEMQSAVYTGEAIPFTTTKGYTNAKVMVWDNLTNLKPVYDVEFVK